MTIYHTVVAFTIRRADNLTIPDDGTGFNISSKNSIRRMFTTVYEVNPYREVQSIIFLNANFRGLLNIVN